MNSCIGDRKVLEPAGVTPLLDLPSVGQNASDHSLFSASWSVNSTETVDSINLNATRFDEAFAEWNKSHTGPFVEPGITHLASLCLDGDAPIFEAQCCSPNLRRSLAS
ncbi:hypothetical protein C8J57DRAFT_1174649 [Mycena rebaudengoi]|nr:hypothetical protein C8J57DRAFT_1174649 [Mycena rebaudengoi]